MPVTHSPGNPFAFSPAVPRGLSYVESDIFKYHKSPNSVASSPRVTNGGCPEDDVQRSEYAYKEYKENVAHEILLKDARIEELERLLLEEGKKMERSVTDNRFLFELQEKQALEIKDLKEDLVNTKQSCDGRVSDLRIANNQLKEDQLASEDDRRARNQAHQRELDNMQASLDAQKRALEAIKTDLTAKNNMLSDKNLRIEELEQRCDENAITRVAGTSEDLEFVTNELSATLSKLLSLETQNATLLARIHKLNEDNASIPVLKEERVALLKKVELLDSLRDDLAAAQVRLMELEREKVAWTDLLDANSNLDLPTVLAEQKSELSAAKTQIGLLEEQLNDANILVISLRADLRKSTQMTEKLTDELSSEKRHLQRLDRAKLMATREIEFLREQIRSYDLEEQMESPNFDPLKAARIGNLETLLDECRNQLLQAQEDKVSLGVKRPREDTSDFNEIERGEYLRKIRTLNAELEIVKQKYALSSQEVSTLKSQISATVSVAPRIIEMRKNPTSAYQAIKTQTLHDLRAENDALLQGLSSSGVVSVPIQSLRNAENEVQRLQGVVAQKEKLMLRLKEVFSAKSSEFREAVYSLLGYRLDFLPNGRVRLRSMYALTLDHAFIFDGEEGTMQLSGDEGGNDNEEFMASVDNLIKFWSEEKHSIPGMLAALTLELLEKAGNDAQTLEDGT